MIALLHEWPHFLEHSPRVRAKHPALIAPWGPFAKPYPGVFTVTIGFEAKPNRGETAIGGLS